LQLGTIRTSVMMSFLLNVPFRIALLTARKAKMVSAVPVVLYIKAATH